MLNKFKVFLLVYLMENSVCSLNELVKLLNTKSRTIYLYVKELNYLLKKNNLKEIEIKRASFSLNLNLKEFKKLVFNSYYSFSQEERVNFICFDIIVFDNKKTLFDYANLFLVSKNTIITDFKKLKEKLANFNLKLKFNFDNKYTITGDELAIRSFLINYLVSFVLNCDEAILSKLVDTTIFKNKIAESEISKSDLVNKNNTDSYLKLLKTYLSILLIYYKKEQFVVIDELDKKILKNLKEFPIAKNLINKFCGIDKIKKDVKDEQYYLTILLTAGNIKINKQNNENWQRFQSLFDLKNVLFKMIGKIEKNHFLFFWNKDKLVVNLINHLIPAYYRIRFNLNINGEYLNIVKQKYNDFFLITSKYIYIIESYLKVKFNEDEIALLTLYLVSNLLYNQKSDEKIKTIIIINQGLNIRHVLKLELESIFLNLDIIKIVTLKEFLKLKEEYDLVLSTVLIPDINYVKINNILNDKDKSKILSEIKLILNQKSKEKPSLNQVLKKKFVKVFEKQNISWQKAIKLSTDILVKQNCIELKYIKAIINNVNQFNHVITLSNKIAMPHASFKDGVKQLSFTFNLFKHPIIFPGKAKFKINLIIILAPVDNEKHIKPMMELVNFLKNKNKVSKILKMEEPDKIYEFIMKGVKNGR